jgi:hypothetical protein
VNAHITELQWLAFDRTAAGYRIARDRSSPKVVLAGSDLAAIVRPMEGSRFAVNIFWLGIVAVCLCSVGCRSDDPGQQDARSLQTALPSTPEPTVWQRLDEFETLARKQCEDLRNVMPPDVNTILRTLDQESQRLSFDMSAVRAQVKATCRDTYDAIFAVQASPTPPPARTPTPVPSPPLMLEKGWRCERTSSSYSELAGEVTNLSSSSLRRVQVVVTYYTADKTFITSDSALIEYDPLLAGQTSPFSVLTRFNPAIASCTIDFKFFGGGSIPFDERP